MTARRKWLRRVMIVVGVWLAFAFALSLVIVVYGEQERAQPADVIIVLGAGIRPDGAPSAALRRRAAHAAALYERGYAEHLLCSGGNTSHLTPRSEGNACREVLLELGVPDGAITVEEGSRSTEENALFSKAVMEQNGWQTAVVVSEPYHLFRAGIIFGQVGITHTLSPSVPPPLGSYAPAVMREIVALHWQLVKTVFGLPNTYVSWP
jgi:uncharacterized SAM-binding protein YcdF (DUF218 family)